MHFADVFHHAALSPAYLKALFSGDELRHQMKDKKVTSRIKRENLALLKFKFLFFCFFFHSLLLDLFHVWIMGATQSKTTQPVIFYNQSSPLQVKQQNIVSCIRGFHTDQFFVFIHSILKDTQNHWKPKRYSSFRTHRTKKERILLTPWCVCSRNLWVLIMKKWSNLSVNVLHKNWSVKESNKNNK